MAADVTLPFDIDRLGFTVSWEHRCGPGAPLYVRVSRGDIVLHLSEHPGHRTPGNVVRAPVADVDRLRDDVHVRADGRMRPGGLDAPDGPTLEVVDPNGNVLRFAQPGAGG
ncbi:hypothetical protein FHR80_000507 [Cellulomonas cellasea]|uniref:Glyoxalase n=1 Tax=Cellulomonas cellasea TaxID=43670 RepID=A0A7W4UCE0_9CELL|nr:hypothetical protein [Cellulomonas cellasea]